MKQEIYLVQRGPNGKFVKVVNESKKEKIQKVAYMKWEAAGQPSGNELHFWLEAEKEICLK